jgi:hypothetical protein
LKPLGEGQAALTNLPLCPGAVACPSPKCHGVGDFFWPYKISVMSETDKNSELDPIDKWDRYQDQKGADDVVSRFAHDLPNGMVRVTKKYGDGSTEEFEEKRENLDWLPEGPDLDELSEEVPDDLSPSPLTFKAFSEDGRVVISFEEYPDIWLAPEDAKDLAGTLLNQAREAKKGRS